MNATETTAVLTALNALDRWFTIDQSRVTVWTDFLAAKAPSMKFDWAKGFVYDWYANEERGMDPRDLVQGWRDYLLYLTHNDPRYLTKFNEAKDTTDSEHRQHLFAELKNYRRELADEYDTDGVPLAVTR